MRFGFVFLGSFASFASLAFESEEITIMNKYIRCIEKRDLHRELRLELCCVERSAPPEDESIVKEEEEPVGMVRKEFVAVAATRETEDSTMGAGRSISKMEGGNAICQLYSAMQR